MNQVTARERSGTKGPRERPSRGPGQSPVLVGGEQRARRVKCRVIQPIQSTGEILLFDEDAGFFECMVRAGNPMRSQLVAAGHNGMLSPATFRMNAVSRHTGWFRIPGVTTRGET
jgi:hypothetical protein